MVPNVTILRYYTWAKSPNNYKNCPLYYIGRHQKLHTNITFGLMQCLTISSTNISTLWLQILLPSIITLEQKCLVNTNTFLSIYGLIQRITCKYYTWADVVFDHYNHYHFYSMVPTVTILKYYTYTKVNGYYKHFPLNLWVDTNNYSQILHLG